MSSSSSSTPPTAAMIEMLAPDGYYDYLGIHKASEVDEDAVKKAYRKLSLKHHPDKPGGDGETFKVLGRAKKVLSNPKLRQQYDVLGLDLDDDEDHKLDDANDDEEQPANQGIIHEIASLALTGVLQIGLRTVMMAVVSVVVVRYIWTVIPALGFLCFIAFRIYSATTPSGSPALSLADFSSPFVLGAGICIMYSAQGRWFYYLVGESMVIGMFAYNSSGALEPSKPLLIGICIFAFLAALWFRGKFWNYAIVIGLEAFIAIFIAVAFPIMEMMLEAVVNEKLKKVGEKVRSHHLLLERYYEAKSNGKS
uniref:J domain-containing protein n=1 Tax=Craspedostauros australis TaxID=1486917 RepID=A0A7R9WYA4_9STRA|mmetsp:Transcript_2333/g.6438  ORF Transcript_2333/g.6438 Transcript_2333/m.6438 type:complete len:309 (+) Transcript_2333:466-1392(+)